eukprot:m.4469 g.4469  ORF g.4469 m.4469 type:complete len:327 (-) comp2995_c0_seq1:1402-2382(-)
MSIPVAIIGFGRAGRIHYSNIVDNPAYRIIYIVDERRPPAEYLQSGERWLNPASPDDVKTLKLDGSLQAVMICSPTNTHHQFCVENLNLGRHVFVEKPLSNKINEICECFELAEKKKLVLLVGFNRRFDPAIIKVRERVNSPAFGKLRYGFTISRDWPYPSQDYLASSTGIFHDCAVHDIDYVNWILGMKPISVNVTHSGGNTKTHNYDYVNIVFKYANDVIVHLNCSRIATSYDQRCEFYGTNGEALNSSFTPGARLTFTERYAASYRNEMNDFAKRIQEGILEPFVTQDDCVATFRIIEACEQSSTENKTIDIHLGTTPMKASL